MMDVQALHGLPPPRHIQGYLVYFAHQQAQILKKKDRERERKHDYSAQLI